MCVSDNREDDTEDSKSYQDVTDLVRFAQVHSDISFLTYSFNYSFAYFFTDSFTCSFAYSITYPITYSFTSPLSPGR